MSQLCLRSLELTVFQYKEEPQSVKMQSKNYILLIFLHPTTLKTRPLDHQVKKETRQKNQHRGKIPMDK